MIVVVIPTLDRYDLLERCLALLPPAMAGADWRCIVVDNGLNAPSPRGKIAHIRGDPSWVFARSCNEGVRLDRFFALVPSDVDWILLLNDDTEPAPGMCASLLATGKRLDASIVGARLMYPGTGLIQHAGVAFTVERCPYHRHRDQPILYLPNDQKRDRLVDAVTFACALIRADLWGSLGGLDESYVNCYEDADFCLRAQEKGAKIALSWDAVAMHHGGGTARDQGFKVEHAVKHYLSIWGPPRRFPVRTSGTYTPAGGEATWPRP